MYYKIQNKECDTYKKLHDLRTYELQIGEENVSAIENKTGFYWEDHLGYSGQQTFSRTTEYRGFAFIQKDKVDAKVWKKDPQHEDIFIPNRRTKAGREMAEFLSNGLKRSRYDKVFDILGLAHPRKFTLPYVEIVGELIILFLSNNQDPKDENLIEITKREFDELLKRAAL